MHPRTLHSRQQQVTVESTAVRPRSFELPWQALILVVVLTLGATVHQFPTFFQPLLRYANGMVLAAAEWRNAPPVNSCEYAGL